MKTADHITANILGDLTGLTRSWLIHLEAANLSPATVYKYGESARQFTEFLGRHVRGRVHPPGEHVIAHQLDTRSPATANTRYRSLQQLFKWLEEEGEISAHGADAAAQARREGGAGPHRRAGARSCGDDERACVRRAARRRCWS